MRWKGLVGLCILFTAGLPVEARVRMTWRDGRRIVYNDGIGESVHAALGQSDEWLRTRVSVPSLYDELIANAAQSQALDPRLVKSVMLVESAFNPIAVSKKGASGLMQLMPETARQHGVQDVFDPADNIRGGARHLAYLMGIFGNDLTRSLAAYNAGEAAVQRYGGVPPYQETQLYVRKALTAYYGKSSNAPIPAATSGAAHPGKGRSVHVTRDAQNRVVLTTDPVRRAPASRETP